MKKLPIKLKRLIKNKTFNTDTTHNRERWHRGGLQINSRITWIKVDNEEYYEKMGGEVITPIDGITLGDIRHIKEYVVKLEMSLNKKLKII